ncbi:DNA ligase [Arcobacter sp. F2176]|uniref:DNA ligase n=1 Tax=Arcobacter sp. F2176 TaxID=2044511 RepID=UPI00100BC83B|nr:DNA ligase [Arcobacter sp. F2176]RXJ78959.1 DNA ligase [Arcobacter sp. F2176]
MLIFIITNIFSLNLEKPKIYKNQEINNWIMSEKLDGIRAYWDGKSLYTKNGNKIFAPTSFTNNFPPFELDGELWSKRDDFENIQSIVLDKVPSSKWSEITYNIFEAPNAKGNFYKRLKKIKDWFDKNPNIKVNIIKQIQCKNKKELDDFLEKIVLLKGEGVIIKNPNLEYVNKRSKNSLKVKKFYDEEGIVQRINYNNEKMKSLEIKLNNGIFFNLGNGFSDKQRLNPPKIGEQITFKYYDLTKNGKPKFASFLRVRKQE